jgi:hypothetical protein
MMNLVRQYGRTCRRYFFDVMNQKTVKVRPGRFDLDVGFHHAIWTAPPPNGSAALITEKGVRLVTERGIQLVTERENV